MSDVQDRLERLRKAGRLRRAGPRPLPAAPSPPPTPKPVAPTEPTPDTETGDLLDLPGMEEVTNRYGSYLLRTIRYDLGHWQGNTTLGDLLAVSADIPATAARDPQLAGIDFRRVAFLDTETSGLAGGAGTIVFLTGVGAFEDDGYVVRQYFARNPAEEPAYLDDLNTQLQALDGVVSFNGKSFDLPLLRTRFLLSGLTPPANDLPHFDLLHPARRLWRARLGACNFGNLEIHILQHQRRGNDVPSWLIPSLWFRYARGEGNVSDMVSVLYHNLEDIVSMVPLAQVICATFAGEIEPHPQDRVALARSLAAQGDLAGAESAYRQALDAQLNESIRIEAMMGLAQVLKRQKRRHLAVEFWETLAPMLDSQNIGPQIELAKYHEWESGDLARAAAWTQSALVRVQAWRPGYYRNQMMAELEHRMQRIQGKLAGKAGE
ncbi:MAG: ribonuclease H-like domain-containing protein [Caldilineales bacterium]|nr:ribonuclease H-like domain-containing protein [Caldilineales bacterium]